MPNRLAQTLKLLTILLITIFIVGGAVQLDECLAAD